MCGHSSPPAIRSTAVILTGSGHRALSVDPTTPQIPQMPGMQQVITKYCYAETSLPRIDRIDKFYRMLHSIWV